MRSTDGLKFWRQFSLGGMVGAEVAIAVGIELLLRRTSLSLASVLFYRSVFALALLFAYLRPSKAEWRPKVSWLAVVRIVTGGLTFLGWFGAIGSLSARVTQAILLLDSLLLASVRSKRQGFERKTIAVLAGALIIFAIQGIREPGTVTSLGKGVAFLAIAIFSRAASYKVWEKAQGSDEHTVWLIAPALVGGALAGLFLGKGHVAATTLPLTAVLVIVAIIGLVGYFYMNEVMRMVRAFYTRVIELWQVPVLWGIHLITDRAQVDLIQGAASMLVAAASAWTYWVYRTSRSGRVDAHGRREA